MKKSDVKDICIFACLAALLKLPLKLRAAIAVNLLSCKDRCKFVLFVRSSGIVPPLAVMSVRQERCLAQASVADLMLIQLHEEEPRRLIHRNVCDSRKSCELLLLRQLQGATLQQQV